MSAPLSVVIPTLNAAGRIGPTLGALADALFDGLIAEVILTDGGSEDDIETVADETGARLVRAGKGRGIQLAAGARAAKGTWLLFLHADSVPAEGWNARVIEHIRHYPDRAGWFQLRFDSPHPMARVTERWANLRSRALCLPYGDQGLLISRNLYQSVGGYPEIPLMEDVALSRRLGRRLRPLGTHVLTSSERYERAGWLRHGAGNLWRLMRYSAGADPARLSRTYRPPRKGSR